MTYHGYKGEEEHIPCIVQMRFQGQIKFLDMFDGFQRDGAFYRLPDARVNVFERMLLFRQLLSTARL